MMRSLWTAASGMIAQQTNVDTISNNIANINTTGYKKEAAQFKALLYQTIQKTSTNADGIDRPVGIQAGLGVKNSAITTQYTQGLLTQTENDFDLAIRGNAFFTVKLGDGSTGYTRNGSFTLANGVNGHTLATSEGYPVLDTAGNPIEVDAKIAEIYGKDDVTLDQAKLKIDENGSLFYPDAKGKLQSLDIKIGLAQFNNPAGLDKSSDSILKATSASGEAVLESDDTTLSKSSIKQGYLESSNVQAVNEMVALIVAQRAYEMNSKTINASDEMLQQANNLRK